MSNVEWDSKTTIGKKANTPKVAKNAADLNGTSDNYSACHVESYPSLVPL
jgi:hypothetical protein